MGKTKKVKGTKQTLEYVEPEFKWHVPRIKCKNQRQKEFLKLMESQEVVIADGYVGSGKTYLAVYQALKDLEKGVVKKVVLVKSVVPIEGEDLGYLPGNQQDKMFPYMLSMLGNIDKLIGEEARKHLMKEHRIEFLPICYTRGINLDNCWVIIDEAQNINYEIFRAIITRIGEKSKYVFTGDSSMQIDRKDKKSSILSRLVELFADDPIVGVCTFTKADCVRNPIITPILDKLDTIQ